MPMNRAMLLSTLIGVVLATLLLSTFRDKPKKVPPDDAHRPFIEALAKGTTREVVEKECINCHDQKGIPLPASHPPKHQCLLCHKAPV